MRIKFLKISILFFLSIGLSACDFLKSKELICKPKVDSLVLREYELVKIKNWEKRILRSVLEWQIYLCTL